MQGRKRLPFLVIIVCMFHLKMGDFRLKTRTQQKNGILVKKLDTIVECQASCDSHGVLTYAWKIGV